METRPPVSDRYDTDSAPFTRRLRRLRVGTRPLLTALALAGSDLTALLLAMLAAVALRWWWGGMHLERFLDLWPSLGLFVLAYGFMGLYFGLALSPADELRRIFYASLLVFLMIGAITYLSGTSEHYSRGVFAMALGFTVVLVPLGRVLMRASCGRCAWWGYPAVIIGSGKTGDQVRRSLLAQPGLGLRPVAILDEGVPADTELDGVPLLGLDAARRLVDRHHVRYAILAMPGEERRKLLDLIESEKELFPHLLIIPDLYGFSSLWVEAKDLGGMLGLEVSRRLLNPWPRLLKRCLDLALTVVGGLCILPLIGLIALAIKLGSRGPVFYGQTRLGMGGHRFKAWKFRSMIADADAILARYLEQHPELREEWERDHKLRDDPRVTLVGRVLRKTSLDELPQLWNVLKGEMSLVGPRPIVDAEVSRYGDQFKLYQRVRPGMTGMWQVSGRNDTGYTERVGFDAYYVRNWSVWLDFYLIARTAKVVMLGRGAY